MPRDDNAIWMLRQLEQLADKLDVDIRYDTLGKTEDKNPPRSGLCRFKDRQIIIVDKDLPTREKCRILAIELRRFDLSQIFVVPAIRDLLSR